MVVAFALMVVAVLKRPHVALLAFTNSEFGGDSTLQFVRDNFDACARALKRACELVCVRCP